MIKKLHVGDEVQMSGEVRRFTVRRLRDYARVQERVITPIQLPEVDPEHWYDLIGVVAVKEVYDKPRVAIILGWTHFVIGRFTKDELDRRTLIEHQRMNVIAVQPWNAEGKFRKPKFCLLEQLTW